MSGLHGRVLPVLAAAAVLVGGANLAAYAANGHPILLGGANHAVGTTTVDNDGHGPALTLKTRPDAPPLAVSSHRKVRHLNADRVDGIPGTALRTRSWTYRIGGDIDEGKVVRVFPGLPPGHYLASYSMIARLYGSGTMTCWFTTPSAPQVKTVFGQAAQVGEAGPLVVQAGGYVDATQPISLTCQAGPAFDTYGVPYDNYDSQVTFVRLDTSSVQRSGVPGS